MNTNPALTAPSIEDLKDEALAHLNTFAKEASKGIEGFTLKEVKFGRVFANEEMLCQDIFVIIDKKSKYIQDNEANLEKITKLLLKIGEAFFQTSFADLTSYFPITRPVREDEHYS
jgi:hypothetical protein